MAYKPIRQVIVAHTGTDLYSSCPISTEISKIKATRKKENIGFVVGRISDVQCTYGSDMG